MSNDVVLTDSPQALVLAAAGLIYLYFLLSIRFLLTGLPVLTGLILHWIVDHRLIREYPRTLFGGLFIVHFSYWISNSSYILYPAFTVVIWNSIALISLCRYEVCYRYLSPIKPVVDARVAALERFVQQIHWPIVDFDGQGIFAITESTLALMQMTFDIAGIDFSLQVDEHTKIIAKVEGFRVRLGRDVTVREVYVKFEGDGTPASAFKSFNSPLRTSTVSSTSSKANELSAETNTLSDNSPLRRGPLPIPAASSINGEVAATATPPKLPPRLPPRRTTQRPDQPDIALSDETEEEKRQLQAAIEASMIPETAHSSRPEVIEERDQSDLTSLETISESADVLHATPRKTSMEEPPALTNRMMSFGQHSTTSYFYPTNDETDSAELKAAFEEGAIHHTSSTDNPELNDFDMKAAIAASLKDQADLHKQRKREKRIQLSEILAKIPWWPKVTPGPLITRLLLSPLIWLHPTKVSSVAATGSGKRITNLMETSGLKKAHPNQEIFNLIRKVFVWLEAGDISVVLNDISVRPHIPISADHDVRIEVTAHEPTAYRNTNGTDDVLAKIAAISATLHVPAFLLPNHEYLIPTTVRSSIPFSVLFSLPGVFNRELLTIGAAFVKATTMMDLRQTAQSRAPPPMPSLSGGGQFSFRSLGQAVKQAAGDLAKQKGVQWGVRDAELAKWTAKLARLMAYIKIDVGGKGEIPVDLIKLRRRVVARKSEHK